MPAPIVPGASEVDPAAEYAEQMLRHCGLPAQRVARLASTEPALDWARSGAMALTGDADGAPRFASGPLATAARAAGMALVALAPRSALARLDLPALLGERAALSGLGRNGRASAGGSARLLPARDGLLALNLPREDDWSLVPAWLARDPSIQKPGDWQAVAARVAAGRVGPLVDRGRLMGLAVSDAPTRIDSDRPWFRIQHASQAPPSAATGPLRLLDLSNLWAGPLAASLLASAGAQVLKIESPDRPDGARSGPAAFFDLINANKAGCALDLQRSRDRAAFERLLDGADIVLESARPRALEQLGYDAGAWVDAVPGRLWVSITGYGRQGPERDWIAFGDDAAVAAGLAWSLPARVEPASPCFCGDAIADPLTGLHAAAIVLAHRHAGRGGLLELSLVDISARAAGFSAGRLELPIERDRDQWCVIWRGEKIPIEAPRARPAIGTAPALLAPNEALLASWSAPC